MDNSPSSPPSLLASEKHLDTNFKQRIFLAFFASLLPLAPLYWPSPSDIRIASNNPCLTPIEDPHTFTSGRTWINKQSCKWLGLACSITAGLPHPLVPDETGDGSGEQAPIGCSLPQIPSNYSDFWRSGTARPEEWDDEERRLREIPQFVIDYAPLIHLYSGEEFWPCDVASHLLHTTPYLNFTPIEEPEKHPDRHWNMSDLGRLGRYGRDVYLMSDDNVEDRPEWLEGKINIPNGDGDDEGGDPFEKHRQWMDEWPDAPDLADVDGYEEDSDPTDLQGALDEEAEQIISELKRRSLTGSPMTAQQGGRSDAPVILIVVDKGNGIVDAFWFFFYSYNLGNKVFNVRFGNHIGDWEHTVVRFEHGLPIQVFYSEHYFGVAYSYSAVEKIGKRPVGFSATGTHAMYGTSGVHRYILPWGLLHDVTDRGPLWDPTLNTHSYTYSPRTNTMRSSTLDPYAPTSWLDFYGHWGDKAYPMSDSRQYKFAGQYHYVSGPSGPKQHQLGRESICQGRGECKIKHWLGEPERRFARHGFAEEEWGNRRGVLDEIQIVMASRWK